MFQNFTILRLISRTFAMRQSQSTYNNEHYAALNDLSSKLQNTHYRCKNTKKINIRRNIFSEYG